MYQLNRKGQRLLSDVSAVAISGLESITKLSIRIRKMPLYKGIFWRNSYFILDKAWLLFGVIEWNSQFFIRLFSCVVRYI